MPVTNRSDPGPAAYYPKTNTSAKGCSMGSRQKPQKGEMFKYRGIFMLIYFKTRSIKVDHYLKAIKDSFKRKI